MNGNAGHCARILVNMDLTNSIPNFIILEVDVMDIEVELHYENLPLFCSACKNIGHGLSFCRLVEKCIIQLKLNHRR